MLHDEVLRLLTEALGPRADGLDLERFLAPPPAPELGDLAFGCFGLARALRDSPANIAADLASRLPAGGLVAGFEAAGPYLNVRADPVALLRETRAALADGRLSPRVEVPSSLLVEFSQPNTHKPFHVGHLRNVALGDSLVRILRAVGHEVVAANYYGDFGIDVAKCLWWLRTHPELRPPETDRTSFLGRAYIDANDALDPERAEPAAREANLAAVREVLRALEAREGEVWSLYEQTRRWCLDEFRDTYAWLGVGFDVDFFESQMEAPARAMVDEGLREGVFTVSDGAVICELPEPFETPALLRKRDGSSLYMTWDLALAKRKFDEFGVDRSLYVVGSEQRYHFRQLFETLRRLGYERAVDCRHVAYELVMLPEGKMSSRAGTAVPLCVLKSEITAMLKRHMEAREAEGDSLRAQRHKARRARTDRAETVRRLAVACLRYGMLSVGTSKRVLFSLDAWTRAEGDTGAYLQYCASRIRSVLEEAGPSVLDAPLPPASDFGGPEERALLGHLLRYPGAVLRAAEQLEPAIVAAWTHDATRAFGTFWHACPVLVAPEPLRTHRLALVSATGQLLERALGLLGIEPVDAM